MLVSIRTSNIDNFLYNAMYIYDMFKLTGNKTSRNLQICVSSRGERVGELSPETPLQGGDRG